MLIIFIAFISLISLLILHEMSHFLVAKKFKVEVEEFGIGYPPRIFGKKIGKTLYSLNLLPFGAFVKISEGDLKTKPVWQRMFIVGAGILSFWIITVVLLSIIFSTGFAYQISDQEELSGAHVQIVSVAPDSPAERAGLGPGDIILGAKIFGHSQDIAKISDIQEFTSLYGEKEIILTIQRGRDIREISLVPRLSPPQGEGSLGVALARVVTKKYPLARAPFEAGLASLRLTGAIVIGLAETIKQAIVREPVAGELMGPVGIFNLFVKSGTLGPVYFLQTVALISLHVAIFNALPIPVVDGGRMLFLGIEKIRKKPLDDKIEQKINSIFFALLILLMIWVTIKDINRLF